MTTANCPRCSEQVTVPKSASREATVRCPLCQEEYSLAEALAQLPPTLIVVSEFGEIAAAAAEDEEVSAWEALNLDDDAEEVAAAPMDNAAPVAAFDFTSGSAAVGGKSKAAIRPSSRSRKPKGSPIKSVLSIVIGGLMAFPIAQLILWYLPGDWKRDFGAGPIVAQYVPQIVPTKFRGSQANAESSDERASQDSGSMIPDFNSGGFGTFGGPDASSGEIASANNKKANNPKKKQKATPSPTLSEEPAVEEQMSLDDSPAASEDVFASPLDVPELELGVLPLIDSPVSPIELPSAFTKVSDEPASELPSRDETPLPVETNKPEVSSLAPGILRNAPQVSADDVVKSVQAAVSGNQAWDADEASVRSGPLKREFYFSLSKLGEALTFAEQSDETVAAQIAATKTLLLEVSQDADKLAVIGGVANGWIAAGGEGRQTNGICLTGVVKTVEPIGNLFETTIETAGKQIAVVSTADPSDFFAADRHVLVLGSILDDPAKNLGGYEGSNAVVVLDGYHVVVAAE